MKVLYVIACVVLVILVTAILYTQIRVEEDVQNLRVTVFANAGHAAPIIGMERGIFAKEITDTIIDLKIFDSGPQAIESLFSGSSDIAYVGPGPAINGFLRSDGEIIILGGAASGGASFVAHPNSDIDSIKSLDGKRVATPQIANTQDVSLRHHLNENDLVTVERGGTVYVINVPNPDIYVLFSKGDIDAAWVPEPWATLLVNKLDGIRIFEEKDVWDNGEFASVLLVARTKYTEQHPQIIQEWLNAHAKSVAWINSNPKESVDILHKFIKRELGASFEREIIAESLSRIVITSDPISSSVEEFASMAHALGYLGRGEYSLDGLYYGMEDSR
ncbi:MAG: aliphatic sulfonate ABC transporter periplasmic ligand-binding protein [Cenarchaeum symbiont of Oopsacas minuta]|nr:aliphatic sulfonate ABC transporter periplasmic ligand-binding protein [Cenarchaeum symbiont of Oopsacas minuta]